MKKDEVSLRNIENADSKYFRCHVEMNKMNPDAPICVLRIDPVGSKGPHVEWEPTEEETEKALRLWEAFNSLRESREIHINLKDNNGFAFEIQLRGERMLRVYIGDPPIEKE